MLDVEGFILVGGRSSRMGTDKSRLQFGGQTSVERIAAELRPITARISLVGPSRAGFGPDLRIVPDTHQQWGALGGIHAALGACVSDWALIVACDLPFVTRDLCSRLLTLSQAESPDAVVPIQPDGRPPPLCALLSMCLRLVHASARAVPKPIAPPSQLMTPLRQLSQILTPQLSRLTASSRRS